jgi:hypothetical protein
VSTGSVVATRWMSRGEAAEVEIEGLGRCTACFE